MWCGKMFDGSSESVIVGASGIAADDGVRNWRKKLFWCYKLCQVNDYRLILF